MKNYSFEEINREMEILKDTFEIVRLVNPITGSVVKNDKTGKLITAGCFCFEAWSKNTRCKNCISSLVLSSHEKASKLEYFDGVLYYVVSRYVIVTGKELVLEAVSRFDKEYTKSILDESNRTEELIRLYKQTNIDELTGIYNRRFLKMKLPALLAAAESSSSTVGVVILDVDNLKKTNDSYGHFAGDAVILTVADILHSSVSDNDGSYVIRVGGDEFVVIFADTDSEAMKLYCDKIMRMIERTEISDYPTIKISASAGGALSSECDQCSEIISLADKRLYKAKASNKVKVIL